ncbi:MAG TPA: hypothetical protein VMV27_07015 [Candidatus Binataceae bacterium]|nr:hypothetical protein [Candidatus Binataceae bacterium]
MSRPEPKSPHKLRARAELAAGLVGDARLAVSGGVQKYAAGNCSGVLQSRFEYSGIFNQFNP